MNNLIKPTFAVVRAIGAEYARRALRPLTIICAVVIVFFLGLGGWLTTVNPWWWFLEAAVILASLFLLTVSIVLLAVLRKLEPAQTKGQRRAVGAFVDKLERVADNLQTPYMVILFRIIRDTLWPQENNLIETMSRDSRTLAPDLIRLRKKFEE